MSATPTPIRDLATLLATLDAHAQPGVWVFTSVPHGTPLPAVPIIASIHEPEGVSLIMAEADALHAALPILARCAWITLTVVSDLHAVGLTAAVASALTAVGLRCNIVAGAYHDHLFVPVEDAASALATLAALQAQSSVNKKTLPLPSR